MRYVGFSNGHDKPARRVITPQLMGRAVMRLRSRRNTMAPPAVRVRGGAVTLLVGLVLARATPVRAQSFGVEMRIGVTHLHAYGGGGAGPDFGMALRLPGGILGATPRIGIAGSAADLPLVGAVGPFVAGHHRQLRLMMGTLSFERHLTGRLRVQLGGVVGRIKSFVPTFSVLAGTGVRPANQAGQVHGMVVGVEAGVGVALIPGMFIDLVAAGMPQRAYTDDPEFMTSFRIGLGVVPAF